MTVWICNGRFASLVRVGDQSPPRCHLPARGGRPCKCIEHRGRPGAVVVGQVGGAVANITLWDSIKLWWQQRTLVRSSPRYRDWGPLRTGTGRCVLAPSAPQVSGRSGLFGHSLSGWLLRVTSERGAVNLGTLQSDQDRQTHAQPRVRTLHCDPSSWRAVLPRASGSFCTHRC